MCQPLCYSTILCDPLWLPMDYDVIGDIHGQAEKLEALLRKLGYTETAGAWRHAARQAVFVGDFIDRGPAQIRSVNIARRMLDAGAAMAVMGNHELNAIAWHTRDPQNPDEFLRPHFSAEHGSKNRKQHAVFLAEVEGKPALHEEIIQWFLTLPLWLDLPELQVVHACWHAKYIAWLSSDRQSGRFLTSGLMAAASKKPQDQAETDDPTPSLFKAVDALTKGLEIALPAGTRFQDKDGFWRDHVRLRWWDERSTTYRSAAMLSAAEREELPDLPIPANARVEGVNKPTFFGHYWLTGVPSLESIRAVCVDYSAGNGGPLVAYRFQGEPHLSPKQFIWVD